MGSRVIAPKEARVELARRELARRRLAEYGRYIYDWWKPTRFHELICEELEQVYRYIETGGVDGTQALIVEVPPQHGKSTIVSRMFTSWVLGKIPDSNIMLATYSADFSSDHSKEVRRIIDSPEFAALFGEKSKSPKPVELSGDSFAKGNWSLEHPHRGGMLAIGVEGGATGRPANLIVIDDPFKNREEADSPTNRQKVKKWMTSSILSRVKKGTAIVLIHTRWHREDLIGEMLKSSQTDSRAIQWKVISLPVIPLQIEEYATSETDQKRAMLAGLYRPLKDPLGRLPGSGEPLWPDMFPREMLDQIRATLDANGQLSDWYSLYEQQPRPSDGVFFSDRMFQIIDRAPDNLVWCGLMDLAIGEKSTSDWNTCARVAYDAESNFYIRDMVRVHDIDSFLDTMIEIMLMPHEKGVIWGVESVAFSKLVFKDFVKNEKLRGISIHERTVDKDKVSRARPVRSLGLAKKLYLVRGPWIQEFLMEALDFPTGRHDDQVDTVSGGLEMAAEEKIFTDGDLVV